MNTCDTCKWWRAPEGDSEKSLCPKIGDCVNPKFDKHLEETLEDEMWAGERASSPLNPLTGPKFGCVQHEEKE